MRLPFISRTTTPEPDDQPANAEATGARRRSKVVTTGIVVLAVIGLTAVGIMVVLGGAGHVAALSGLCGSCHEMAPATTSWGTSSHAKTSCYSCHDALYAWYDLPRNMFGSRSMLRRNLSTRFVTVQQHLSGDYSGATTSTVTPPVVPVATSDTVCLECHTLSRTPSSRDRITIEHEEHARANDSCISCHLVTAHPDPDADRNLVMMGQCYACHDLDPEIGAPGECERCHPDTFDLLPTSHDPAVWEVQHGKAALADREHCFMCHTSISCRECHGIDMPHPVDWIDRASGHAKIDFPDHQVCVMCHPAQPDPCSTCHHQGHNPARGAWADQHVWVARETGTAACMRCHDGVFCKQCHG